MPFHYQAYLVDFDGTLYHAEPVRLAMLAELLMLGVSVIPTLREFRRQHEVLRATLQDQVDNPFLLQIERTAERVGIAPEEVRRRVDEWMIRRPQKWIARFTRTKLIEELVEFQRGGGRLALVSDYPATEKLRALSSALHFEVIVANGEPGGPRRLKPHPDGYLDAARRLGVAPERCLILGDRLDADGVAAERAGIAFRQIR